MTPALISARIRIAASIFVILASGCHDLIGQDQHDVKPIFDSDGFYVPGLPDDLTTFDAGKYFESIKIGDPARFLSKEERQSVQVMCLQVCEITHSVVHKDSSFSVNAPVWKLLINQFPDLKSEANQKLLVKDGRVSVLTLLNVLWKQK